MAPSTTETPNDDMMTMTDMEDDKDNDDVHYELLGAPTLLYRDYSRHASTTTGRSGGRSSLLLPSPWGLEPHSCRYFHSTLQRIQRIRARWYHLHSLTHPVSAAAADDDNTTAGTCGVPSRKRKRQTTRVNDSGDDDSDDDDEGQGEEEAASTLPKGSETTTTAATATAEDDNIVEGNVQAARNESPTREEEAASTLPKGSESTTATSATATADDNIIVEGNVQATSNESTARGSSIDDTNTGSKGDTEATQSGIRALLAAAAVHDDDGDGDKQQQWSQQLTGDETEKQEEEEGEMSQKDKSEVPTTEEVRASAAARSNDDDDNGDKQQRSQQLTSNETEKEEEEEDEISLKDKPEVPPTSEEVNKKKKKVRKKRVDPLLDPVFLSTRTNPVVHAARQHLLRGVSTAATAREQEQFNVVTCRSYQQYDHPYLPATKRQSKRLGLKRHRIHIGRSINIDRIDADAAYLAPIDYSSLHYCIDDNDEDDQPPRTKEEKKLSTSKRRRKKYPIEATDCDDSPLMYGNCLVCLPCPCRACQEQHVINDHDSHDDDDDSMTDGQEQNDKRRSQQHHCSWCLLHPTGELLSRICVSNLVLPHGATNSAPSRRRGKHKKHKHQHEVDVGETILQIAPCGSGQISNAVDEKNEGVFVVRSANYCTVIRVRTDCHKKNERQSVCSGLYSIEELTRIDLRSLSRWFPSYKPMDVATHPRYGNALSSPKLAILSRSRCDMQCNTIHHVSLRDTPFIDEHIIASLKSISSIDFSSTHPMTLFAAAESYVRPKLVSNIYSTKPLLGHGHSLYTIDLRSNDATFQWSPSSEEMIVEGVHSISGIMTDWKRTHMVWVSSISAGKTWEIDSRMPCRAVNSFSLPSMTEEGRTLLPAMGLYGGGSLLTKAVVCSYGLEATRSYPILSVDKTPGAFGIHVYQRPEFRPRFQTNSLEVVAGMGLSTGDNEASIAKSCCVPLADVSERVFTCGLASFRTSVSEFLSPNAADVLGHDRKPTGVLCAVTMTNNGDLYSHSLLECDNEQGNKARAYPGLPLGCAALVVPESSNSDGHKDEVIRLERPERKSRGGWNLPLRLSNEFPLAANELAPLSVKARKECRSFKTVRLEHLPVLPVAKQVLRREDQTHKASLGLPAELTTAAQQEVASFQNCFVNDRKSLIESQDRCAYDELQTDMTSEIFQTASDLWHGEKSIDNHIVTNDKGKPDASHSRSQASI